MPPATDRAARLDAHEEVQVELGRYGAWCSLESGSLADAVAAAQRIEALGYSALWQPIALRRDVMVTASQQLAATKRLVIATGIATIYERAPLVMDAGASLAGASASGAAPPAGPRVLAAIGPKMLALARDRAQGAHPYFMPPEQTRRAREILGPDRWLCPEVKVVLESDPDRARALARAAGALNIPLPNYQRAWREVGFEDHDFASGGSDRLIDATVAWGDLAAIRKHLDRHFEAGADQVCINAVGPDGVGAGPHWETLEARAPGR